MTYVPIIVSSTPTAPSPRTRELADRLARVIVDFEDKYPTVTKAEVRQATQLAVRAAGGGRDVARVLALALGAASAVGIGLFAFISQARGGTGSGGGSVPVVAVAILVGVVAIVAIALRRRQ